MYASIFNARGKRFQLVIHNQPGLDGDSVQSEQYFDSKAAAKAAAKALGAKAWNY